MFNTLPSNKTASTGGGAASGSSSDYGYWPVLGARTIFGAAAFDDPMKANRVEGFAGDGDYIELPIDAATSIEYFNSAGASQWTASRANINAAVNKWGGYLLSGGDSLIYVVGIDTGTIPNTLHTASINSAGTVTAIGSAQLTTDFTTAPRGADSGVNTNGADAVYRDTEDAGNLFLRQTETGGFQEAEIDIANGAIIANPTVMSGGGHYVSMHTPVGNYLGAYSNFSNPQRKRWTVSLDTAVWGAVGIPTSLSAKYLQWKGTWVLHEPSRDSNAYVKAVWPTATLDAWVDSMVTKLGGG